MQFWAPAPTSVGEWVFLPPHASGIYDGIQGAIAQGGNTLARLRNLTLAAALLPLCASPVGAQSLNDELNGLVQTHPQIQAKQQSVSAAEQAIGVARSGYLPTLKIIGDSGPEWVSSSITSSSQGKNFFRGRESGGLVLSQHLFDGMATDSAVEAAKAGRRIADSDLRTARQGALLEGATAYLQVLRSLELIQFASDSERMVREQLNLEDERVQKGGGISSDVLAAKQRLQTAKEARVHFQGDLQAATAKYLQVFGHPPETARMAEPPVPASLVPDSIEAAVATAEQDNPSVETANRAIDLAEQRRNTAESGYYPNLDLVSRWDTSDGDGGVDGLHRDWSVLVTASWEVFSGFKTKRAVAQAAYEHGASQDSLRYAQRKAEESVRTAWYKMTNARERVDLLDNAAALAEEVFAAAKRRREAGKATVREVLDEETRINDARIGYTAAYFDWVTATYELLAAMGRLEVDTLAQATPASAGPAGGAVQPSTMKNADQM